MLDINNIFNSFKQQKSIDPVEEAMADQLMDKFPILKLITFSKLMSQHESYRLSLLTQFNEPKYEEKFKDLMESGERLFFSKGWDLVKDLNLENPELIEGIEFKQEEDPESLKNISKWIDFVIDYFIKVEEYEKCSHLTKLKKLISFEKVSL